MRHLVIAVVILVAPSFAAGGTNWSFQLPSAFAPLAGGGYANDFEAGSLGSEMATTAVDAIVGLPDPDAWCTVAGGVLSAPPYDGTFDFEMGLAVSAHTWHAVRNALVVGLDGTGHGGPFELEFQLYSHGDSNDPVDGVWLSTDGAVWHHVTGVDALGNTGLGWADWAAAKGAWASVSFDLAQAATANGLNLNGNFYVAFAEQGKLPIGFFDGVALDALSIDAGAWLDLGGGLGGTSGVPELAASGDLGAGSMVTLSLTQAVPLSSAALVIGVTRIDVPFLGGTLVPSPDIVLFGLPTDGLGAIAFSAPLPVGVLSSTTFYLQYWIADPGAVFGYSASNAVSGTTP